MNWKRISPVWGSLVRILFRTLHHTSYRPPSLGRPFVQGDQALLAANFAHISNSQRPFHTLAPISTVASTRRFVIGRSILASYWVYSMMKSSDGPFLVRANVSSREDLGSS